MNPVTLPRALTLKILINVPELVKSSQHVIVIKGIRERGENEAPLFKIVSCRIL